MCAGFWLLVVAGMECFGAGVCLEALARLKRLIGGMLVVVFSRVSGMAAGIRRRLIFWFGRCGMPLTLAINRLICTEEENMSEKK